MLLNYLVRYVKQTSNRKGVEKTFARKECQREFLQIWRLGNKGLRAATTEKSGKYNRQKVLFISVIKFTGSYFLQLFVCVCVCVCVRGAVCVCVQKTCKIITS